ncbi:hypothetical protein BLNAU_838 [Blattamonas nauphoetae]|uniref:Uncharacterized protein n=1 Tax=Blattamonas nauphoetae TaxID=2049346 RepID=A0ABQ9YKM0_9EUKA|nr:hypothetical protein BLNAU_838 [Blattamonas nauphoetae]
MILLTPPTIFNTQSSLETLTPSESCSLSIVYKPQFSLAHRFLGSASVAEIGQGHQFTAFYGGTEASDDAKLLFPIASGAKQENQKKKVLKGAPMLPVTQYSLPTSQSSTSPASSSTISHYLSQPTSASSSSNPSLPP